MVASVRFIGNVLIALLGTAMFRFRKARRQGTRKSPTAQERLLTEPDQSEPQPVPPRTGGAAAAGYAAAGAPEVRQKTNHRPPISLWSGYRPPIGEPPRSEDEWETETTCSSARITSRRIERSRGTREPGAGRKRSGTPGSRGIERWDPPRRSQPTSEIPARLVPMIPGYVSRVADWTPRGGLVLHDP